MKTILLILVWLNVFHCYAFGQGQIIVGEPANIHFSGGIITFNEMVEIQGNIHHSNGEVVFKSGYTLSQYGVYDATGTPKITLPISDSLGTYFYPLGVDEFRTPVTIQFTEAPNNPGFLSVKSAQLYDVVPDDFKMYPDPVNNLNPNLYFFHPTFVDMDGYLMDRHSTIFWEVSSNDIATGKYSVSIQLDSASSIKGINSVSDLHLVLGGDIPTNDSTAILFSDTGTHIAGQYSNGNISLQRSNIDGGSFGNYFIGTNWRDNNLVTPSPDELIFYEPFDSISFQNNHNKFGWKTNGTALQLQPSTQGAATGNIFQISKNGQSEDVFKFTVTTDSLYDNVGMTQRFRSELQFSDDPFFTKIHPAELWYSWDFMIDDSTDILDNLSIKGITIGQWHSSSYFDDYNGSSPVVEINYRKLNSGADAIRLNIRSNNFYSGADDDTSSVLKEIELDQWYRVKLHIIWAHTHNTGIVEFWFDSTNSISAPEYIGEFNYPSLQNAAPNYPKFGIYTGKRDDSVTEPLGHKRMTIFYDDIIMAKNETTLDSLITSISSKTVHDPDLIVTDEKLLDTTFRLFQNYPNPFNPSTEISYSLPEASFVKLDIINMLGQRVATLVNERKTAGIYTVDFDAAQFSSGVYFYTIEAGGFTQTKKMLLIK